MKKLIIAAAIVCAAAISQAAAINWSVDNIYKADGTTMWETDPGLYLAKSTGAGNVIVSGKGGFDYDDGWNSSGGKYELTSGTDKNGDIFVVCTADGTAVTDLEGGALTYELKGFDDSSSKIAQLAWDGTIAVPEPTSGLLLLLGMAGLALRRRRA